MVEQIKATEAADYIRGLGTTRDATWQSKAILRENEERRVRECVDEVEHLERLLAEAVRMKNLLEQREDWCRRTHAEEPNDDGLSKQPSNWAPGKRSEALGDVERLARERDEARALARQFHAYAPPRAEKSAEFAWLEDQVPEQANNDEEDQP